MMVEGLFERIDKLNDAYIKIWQDVCNIESPGIKKEQVDLAGRYIADWAKKKGWKVHIEPIKGAGDIVWITLNPEAEGQGIFLSGHLDTVHPMGLLANRRCGARGIPFMAPVLPIARAELLAR
jgi:acetylornithine deacetylase/succinyl-diaminopimelate desuccinylase-like protein